MQRCSAFNRPTFQNYFGTRVRYTGISFGCQVAAALWRRIIANCRDALAVYMGNTAGVSVMLILLAI